MGLVMGAVRVGRVLDLEINKFTILTICQFSSFMQFVAAGWMGKRREREVGQGGFGAVGEDLAAS